jgi:hypothetical protein
MRSGLPAVILMLLVARVEAPGTVKGYVVDRHGFALPGAEVLAVSTGGASARAVTDSAGLYELRDLGVGVHSVSARLTGFSPPRSKDVRVTDGSTEEANFVLCPVLEEIDYPITPVPEQWRLSTVVLRVRIIATGTSRTGCAEEDFEYTALVAEVFKNSASRVAAKTIVFGQENWQGEGRAYAVGQDMVVFLRETPLGLRRTAGPQSAILLRPGEGSAILEIVRTLARKTERH